MNKKEISKQYTPRDYFSYSQFSSFKYNKQQFLDSYYYGKKQDSIYLDMGKKLGNALQFRNTKEIKVIENIKKQIPPADIYEKELKTTFKGIKLLCYLDGYSKIKNEVMEFKTGKKPSEASWKNQMMFYSLALYLINKKLPKKITLYWMRTEFNENKQLVLTGEVKKYNIVISIRDIILFSAEIIKVWEGIKKLCEYEFLQSGILPIGRK